MPRNTISNENVLSILSLSGKPCDGCNFVQKKSFLRNIWRGKYHVMFMLTLWFGAEIWLLTGVLEYEYFIAGV